jgi:hypothetical protein
MPKAVVGSVSSSSFEAMRVMPPSEGKERGRVSESVDEHAGEVGGGREPLSEAVCPEGLGG